MSFVEHTPISGAVPLAQVRYPLHKLLTSIDTSLHTVGMHCHELRKLCGTNASLRRIQTAKRQLLNEERDLRGLVTQLARLKGRVDEMDHRELDEQITPLHSKYNDLVSEFTSTCAIVNRYCKRDDVMTSSTLETDWAHGTGDGQDAESRNPYDPAFADQLQVYDEAAVIADRQREMAELEEELGELSELFQDVLAMVQLQGEDLDLIDTHMSEAEEHVQEGARHLISANRHKAAAYPLAGALIGGVLLGPVGFLVGLKAAGAVTGIIGLGAGAFAGKMVKNKVNESNDRAEASLHDREAEALMARATR